MRSLAWGIAVGLVASTLSLGSVALPCPPLGFDSMPNLDQAKFLSGTWHAQLQANGFLGRARSITPRPWSLRLQAC